MLRAAPQTKATASLLCLLLLAACGSQQSSEQAQEVEFQAPAPAEPAGTAAPQAAPPPSGILNFSAPKLGGGKVVGSEFAGQNLAVWFWAPW